MNKHHYEKFFTIEQISGMKASEHTVIKNAEEVAQKVIFLTMVSGFLTIVSLIALMIWMSKIVIFMSIVNALVTYIIGLLGYSSYRDYIKAVNKVKERLL